jgi:hypothetical protein
MPKTEEWSKAINWKGEKQSHNLQNEEEPQQNQMPLSSASAKTVRMCLVGWIYMDGIMD